MSLQRCLSRIGKNIRGEDLRAIEARVRENMDRGMAQGQAEQQAVLAQLDIVMAEQQQILDGLRESDVPLPDPAVVRGPETAQTMEGEDGQQQRTEEDAEAERNQPIGELRGLYKWWQRINRLFVSAADNLENTKGGKYLADAVRGYMFAVRERRGAAYEIWEPKLQAFYALGRKDRQKVNDEFSAYWEAVEHRPGTEKQVYQQAQKETRDLIDAWKKIATLTGRDLTNLGVQVKDGKKWRPLRQVENFFPRTPDPDVRRVLNYPEKYQEQWNKIADALIDGGHIKTRAELHEYGSKHILPDLTANDYFAGIEMARGELLPPQFYKRDIQAAINYIERYSDRASQIEHFGQDTGDGDIFDKAKITHPSTANYVKSLQATLYNRRTNDIWTRVIGHLNVAATAIQLGNPATATLNLIGGMALNVVTYGNRAAIQAFRELAQVGYQALEAEGASWKALKAPFRGYKELKKTAIGLGDLRSVHMSLARDLGEQDAIMGLYGREVNVSNFLRKATEKMLKWGGYTPTENFIRTMGMVMGQHYLRNTLELSKAHPKSSEMKRRIEWFKRNGFSFEELAAENGSGRITANFLRYASMLPQGSYQLDQVPIFVDTPWGRFFFKYQKFGTQINRLFFKNHFGPFLKTLGEGHTGEDRARAAVPLIQYLGTLFLAGEAIGLLREQFFDYIRRGPGWDELVKAFDDDDRARAFGLAAGRAYHGMITAGATGFLGNYGQMFMDFTQQERVKNPLDPPGTAVIAAIGDLALRLQGQRTLTAKDLDEVMERTLSSYRTYKRAGLKAVMAVNEDIALGQRQAHRADTRYIRGAAARYAKDQGIEGARVTGPGTFGRTPMSPVNRKITDAMREGNPWKARQIIRDHLRGLSPDDRDSALRSIRASVRNSQPIRIHGQPPNAEQREEFQRWARRNLSDANYQRIREREREWQRYTQIALDL